MEKEIDASDNELQSATELAQAGAVAVGAGKMPWYSPKLRVIQVSQETATPCPSGGCFG